MCGAGPPADHEPCCGGSEPNGKDDPPGGLPFSESPRHSGPAPDKYAQEQLDLFTDYDTVTRERAEEQAALERERLLEDIGPEHPAAVFTWFKPDARKDGGMYASATGRLRRLDRIGRNLILADGSIIPIENLPEVDGPLWNAFED